MNVQVPESFRDYANDKVIRSVVDHLLDQSDSDLPVDDWDEVPAYYQAWLSAQKVRTDYALLLFSLWDAVWKPALEEAGLDELSIHEVKKWEKSHRPTRENIWDCGLNRLFHTSFQGEEVVLQTWAGDDTDNGIVIQAVLYNAYEEEITQRLIPSLSNRWKTELEDDGFCIPDTCCILEKGITELDVSLLKLAAQDLLRAIK